MNKKILQDLSFVGEVNKVEIKRVPKLLRVVIDIDEGQYSPTLAGLLMAYSTQEVHFKVAMIPLEGSVGEMPSLAPTIGTMASVVIPKKLTAQYAGLIKQIALENGYGIEKMHKLYRDRYGYEHFSLLDPLLQEEVIKQLERDLDQAKGWVSSPEEM